MRNNNSCKRQEHKFYHDFLKIYIAQPITGVSKEHYTKVRQTLEDLCEIEFGEKRCQFVNAYIEDTPPKECKNALLWYLVKSLEKLTEADFIVMVKDADRVSLGCKVEKLCAKLYGIPVFEKEVL